MNLRTRCLLAAALLLAPTAVLPAGMTSHALMADYGRQALPEGVLRQILTAHRPALLAGAIYPDGGYGSGSAFPEDRDMAEHAHWGEFHIEFVRYLRELGCGAQASRLLNLPLPVAPPGGSVNNPAGIYDLAGLTDECGMLIAFAFGDAAHGMTDETWDAQFEPEVRHRQEDPNLAEFFEGEGFWGPFAPGANPFLRALWSATPMNGIEYTMDVIGIVEHHLWINSPALVFPPTPHLIEVYRRSGKTVRPEQVERGNLFSRGAVQAQADTAHLDYQRVRAHMPWASNNYFLSPGGIVPSGHIVAGMYQHMWRMLTSDPRTVIEPHVVGHFPWHGQTDVVLERAQGSWTDHRWLHVFFDSEVDPASIEQPGAFKLLDRAGTPVDVTVEGGHGWSRHWSHSTRVRLNEDLKPNHRYTAVVSFAVKDWSGRRVRRYSWQFTTARE